MEVATPDVRQTGLLSGIQGAVAGGDGREAFLGGMRGASAGGNDRGSLVFLEPGMEVTTLVGAEIRGYHKQRHTYISLKRKVYYKEAKKNFCSDLGRQSSRMLYR